MEMFIGVLLIGALILYIIPSIIAGQRDVAHQGSIIAINLFLGWTVIGWLAALIWACTDEPGRKLDTGAKDDEGFNIVLDPRCAKPGPAWTRAAIGLPVKLVTEESGDERQCSIESEFGTVATIGDAEVINRISFRTEAQGRPRAKVFAVNDDGTQRSIHIGIRFVPEAQPA